MQKKCFLKVLHFRRFASMAMFIAAKRQVGWVCACAVCATQVRTHCTIQPNEKSSPVLGVWPVMVWTIVVVSSRPRSTGKQPRGCVSTIGWSHTKLSIRLRAAHYVCLRWRQTKQFFRLMFSRGFLVFVSRHGYEGGQLGQNCLFDSANAELNSETLFW